MRRGELFIFLRRARIVCVPNLTAWKAVIVMAEPYNVRKRIRIPDYNYSTEGIYFITICAYRRKCIFSRVMKGDKFTADYVVPTPLGRLVEDNLSLIPQVYCSVSVLNACVMPNHVHFLLKVDSDGVESADRSKMLVSKVVQSFKASVTRKAAAPSGQVWQPRFYDHVVRNEYDLIKIWQYIDNNPAKWCEDCYYSASEDQ